MCCGFGRSTYGSCQLHNLELHMSRREREMMLAAVWGSAFTWYLQTRDLSQKATHFDVSNAHTHANKLRSWAEQSIDNRGEE
jgi:hypothetical protein